MKRRNFLKNLGIGAVAVTVAPKIITELAKDEVKVDVANTSELINDDDSLPAIVNNDYYFSFYTEHHLQLNDTIIVSDGKNEQPHIVTEIFHNNTIKAIPMTSTDYNFKGLVEVCHIGRKYKYDLI